MRRSDCDGALPHDRSPLIIERHLERALRDAEPCPDLTRTIMGRLGYMRGTAAASRRQMVRRWAGRGAVLSATLVATFMGVHVFQRSPYARRSESPTVPAALRRDLEIHQHRIGNMIQTIRELAPHPSRSPASPGPDVDDDGEESRELWNDSFLAPVQWV